MRKRMPMLSVLLLALITIWGGRAWAGPVVIDGTDANEHGGVSGSGNFGGWLYMQKVLENLRPAVGNGQTQVVTLGTTLGTTARNAIQSAFNLSNLPGNGWTITHLDGTTAIGNYFTGVGTTTLANTGILYIPTVGNAFGDMTLAELGIVNANAAAINTYVSGAGTPLLGGGLFAQGESPGTTGAYGWLTTLIPGIVVTDVGGGSAGATNITLTAAGAAAFPGLTNLDLVNADPWHNYFSGSFGGLSVLGTAPQVGGFTRNIILGGGAGTVIGCGQPGQAPCPPQVPEPSTLLLLGSGLAALGWAKRKMKVGS